MSEWQELGTPLSQIAKRARCARWSGVTAITLGWVAVAFLAVACGWLATSAPAAVDRAALALGGALPVILMAWYSHGEWRLRRAQEDSVAAYLAELRDRLALEATYGGSWTASAFVLGFSSAWLPWKLTADWTFYQANPHLAWSRVGGLFIIFALTALAQVITTRRARRKVEALTNLLAEIDPDEVSRF